MLSFLYVYSDHSILECYNLFSGVELSMRSFFVIPVRGRTAGTAGKPLPKDEKQAKERVRKNRKPWLGCWGD